MLRGNLYRLPLPDRARGQHSLQGPPFVPSASPPHHLAGRDPALAGAALQYHGNSSGCPTGLQPFEPLHFLQAQATFVRICLPPQANGTMWSSSGARSSDVPRLDLSVFRPHIWQRHESRSNISNGSNLSASVAYFRARRAASFALTFSGLARFQAFRWALHHSGLAARHAASAAFFLSALAAAQAFFLWASRSASASRLIRSFADFLSALVKCHAFVVAFLRSALAAVHARTLAWLHGLHFPFSYRSAKPHFEQSMAQVCWNKPKKQVCFTTRLRLGFHIERPAGFCGRSTPHP